MSQRRSALGRGLGALISNPAQRGEARNAEPASRPDSTRDSDSTRDGVNTNLSRTDEERAGRGLQELEIALIDPNPDQPRREFDPATLEQLALSIRQHGVLQPVVVRRAGARYELVMGERRFRASQLAGRRTLPAVIVDVDPADRLELAIVENVQREDLNPIELAHAYQALSEAGYTQDEIGRKVAQSRPSIANHLRLLDLSRAIQADVEAGRLSLGHAKALLQVSDLEAREGLRVRILDESLAVRVVERVARELNSGGSASSRATRRAKPAAGQLDPDTRAFVERIERHLQTKVDLHPSADGSGKLEVSYFDLGDLERIGRMLLGESR